MVLSKWVLEAATYFNLCNDDRYVLHKIICNIFDESSVKFDINIHKGVYIILIQSNTAISNKPSYGIIQSKPIQIENFTSGKYKLNVNVNAVRQVKIPGKKNSKKIPLIANQIEPWINSRSNAWGIKCNNINVGATNKNISIKNDKPIYCNSHNVTFECSVTDVTLFQQMILNGIGSQRSFGCGMIKAIKK